MARVHWWSFLVNEEGQPIEAADISIKLAGSDTGAYIYKDEIAGSPDNNLPQLQSQQNGYFEFWVPDQNEQYGYASNQKFKIEWNKPGIASGYIDYIDIFASIIAVNEYDDNTVRDKAISNNLARLWENHRLNKTHLVHGIEEVDETDEQNTIKNKLLSNSLAYDWESHTSYTFSTSGALESLGAHGVETIGLDESIDSTDDRYYRENRLISYYYGKTWDNHVNKNYNEYPHGIDQANEDNDDTTKNKLISNKQLYDLYHKFRHYETITTSEWSPSGANYVADITHNMEEDYVIVQMWNTDTKEQESPITIQSLDLNNIRLEHDDDINARIIILK